MTRPVQVPASNSDSRKRHKLKRAADETGSIADRLIAYADRIAITYQDPDARNAAMGVLYDAARELHRLSRELDQVLQLHVDNLAPRRQPTSVHPDGRRRRDVPLNGGDVR